MVGEVVEVGDGGAAPAVDGLAGVADGGDGVAGALAEQAGEQQALGDGGVLVFVEEDDAELLAQGRADLGAGGGEGGGRGDLVAEVEEVAAAFFVAVGADEAEEFAAGAGGFGDLAQVGVGEPDAVEGGEEVAVVGVQAGGVHEVFGELGVEREEVFDQGRQGFGERRIGAGGGAQDAGGELEAGGVGEQAGARFEADAQAVVLEELPGEGVVGGDAGLAGGPVGPGGAGRERVGVGDAGLEQGGADALGELAGGLVGEGQPEDLFRGDLPRAHQPHHAGGHHRRLAGAGSGHDDLRGGRGGDALRLLRRERDAEELLELLGVAEVGHVENRNRRH